MDSQEEVSERSNKKGLHIIILRCSVALVFAVASFLSLSFLVGFAAIFIGDLSVNSPISVPSQCKIVSSSVDLRSSKVCELGLLNYKAKHVVYPFERKKFRCRYDYYWASIFKVQYKDHSSGQMRFALAEAPNEALPLDCRPNFGAAWLTKDKFKVNETYDCWYTSGFSKVDIYYDNIFSCQAKDPSAFEMIKRYTILSMRILGSWFTSKRRVTFLKWETIAGVISGKVRIKNSRTNSLERIHSKTNALQPSSLIVNPPLIDLLPPRFQSLPWQFKPFSPVRTPQQSRTNLLAQGRNWLARSAKISQGLHD